jgi:Flp pilus assembly protein TadD
MLITTESTTALDEFKDGVRFLRDRQHNDALEHFRAASRLEPQNPYYLSFLGLSIALAERKWSKAAELCTEALRLKRTEMQIHLNLVEVYLAAGRIEEAVRALDVAETHFGADARIERFRKKLGKRRKPVLQFLDRDHVVNHKLGKLRHRLLGARKRSF